MSLLPLIQTGKILTGKITEIKIEGVSVILVNHEDTVLAYNGVCPHQGAALALGKIEGGDIVCAMHQMKFSCKDGSKKGQNECLTAYPLLEKEGMLYIDSMDLHEGMEKERSKLSQFKDLPSPKGKPVVGHLPQFKAPGRHLQLESWAREIGPIYRMSLMGKKVTVSGDHDFNLQVLKQRPSKFRRYYKIQEIMEEMGIYGTFNVEGDEWVLHRKLTAEALSHRNVKSYFPTTMEVTKRLYNRWIRITKEQDRIDVQKEMTRFTVDITTCIAFGHDGNTLEQGGDVIQDHLDKVFPMINKRIASPIPTWRYFKSKEVKAFDFSLQEIRRHVQKYIDASKERLANDPKLKETPTNFLESILAQQENEGGFTDKEVFGNVFTMLLAGEDTTSNSIAWSLFYLATHPEAYLKMREEVDALNCSENWVSDYDELAKLEYTEGVINEAMRLKPVGPIGSMQANEDIVINNHLIKKDMVVMMLNRIAHTDKENFENPEEFNPERWVEKEATGCPMHAHKPDLLRGFGAGPRFCPGKALAIQEIKMALAMICMNFDIELAVKKEDVRENYSFSMYTENLFLKISARSSKKVVAV